MKQPYCLDIDNGIYKLGDLNLMLLNQEHVDYPPVDNQKPDKPFFMGCIRQQVVIHGEVRPFLVYIPENFPISGAGLFLYPDDGVDCVSFLEHSEWKSVSEEFGTVLIVLESRTGGWDHADIQSEIEYSEAVFKKAISRVYFSLNEATYYIMGLGGGAYPTVAYGLLNSSLFSCILADGDYQLAPQLLEQLKTIQSDRDASRSKLDVIMPAWLVRRSEQTEDPVLQSLLHANQAEDRGLRDGQTVVFQQDVRCWQNEVDALPISEVRCTDSVQAANSKPSALHRRMLSFALRFKRWLTIGNGRFRPARTYEQMNLKRFEMQVDGLRREWYVYAPSAHQQEPARKLPLLLAIHGYSCTGAMFAENSEWHMVGERRGFFVVYVSAFPSNKAFGRHTVPLPTWNAVGMQADADDIHYIREVLKQVKAQYPIDTERVYVSGHSNGSLFTQTLMKEMPLEFAAFAPQGAQIHMALGKVDDLDQRDIQPDGILRPVWLMMGEEDIGDGARIEPSNANDRFLAMMCRVNGLDRSKGQYLENGNYHTYTYPDALGTPMLRFTGIAHAPHAFAQEYAQIYWDQFLCHFRRRADGSIVYTL